MKYLIIVIICLSILFLACKQTEETDVVHSNTSKTSSCIELGQEISGASFASLSSQLSQAMKKGGPDMAINYCNIEAVPIIDSLQAHYNANISRTTDRLRSPLNKPSDAESKIILEFQSSLNKGDLLQPKCIEKEETYNYYSPIIVSANCLKCHGDKDKMEVYPEILKLYPDDLAINYKVGDLRGIWSIQIPKINKQ